MTARATASQFSIDLSSDVTGFFRQQVGDALREEHFDATEAAETYLVLLLADFAKPQPLTGETFLRPLTLQLAEAMQAGGSERFERLRTLGDGVLYLSGFFAEHLKRRGVAKNYVNTLGARAYHGAASTLRQSAALSGSDGTGAPDLFVELAENFTRFVRLLTRVADAVLASSAHSDEGTLKLYERWLKTGSVALSDELITRGVLPVRGDGTLH